MPTTNVKARETSVGRVVWPAVSASVVVVNSATALLCFGKCLVMLQYELCLMCVCVCNCVVENGNAFQESSNIAEIQATKIYCEQIPPDVRKLRLGVCYCKSSLTMCV